MGRIRTLFVLLTLAATSHAVMFANQTIVNYDARAAYELTDPLVILGNFSTTDTQAWYNDIIVLTNTGSNGGSPGIVYDRGTACDTSFHPAPGSLLSPPNSLTRKVPLIALIRRGNCTFDQKLNTAVWDGASMAIIYDTNLINSSVAYNWGFKGNQVLPESELTGETTIRTNPNISSVFIDARIGQTLYDLLNATRVASNEGVGYDNDEFYLNSFNRQPPQYPRLSGAPNELAVAKYLVVQFYDGQGDSDPFKSFQPPVGDRSGDQVMTEPEKDAAISLPIVFIFVVGLGTFFYVRRRNVKKRAERRAAATLRWRPASSHFEQLPVALPIKSSDASNNKPSYKSTDVPISSRPPVVPETVILQLPTRPYNHTIRPNAETPLGGIMSQLSNGAVSQKWELNDPEPTCVMCADSYQPGEMVTTLGCGHEGHQACVARYLQGTSSMCPVCKFDVLARRREVNPFVMDEDEEEELGAEVHVE